MDLKALHRYLAIRDRMAGWFSPGAARLFAWVNRIQKEAGVVGDLFEIGVHQGKSTVLLGLMTDFRKESLGVCDLFDSQERNVTGSGNGNKGIFLSNFDSYVGNRDFLRVYEKSSGELTLEETGTRCRFFYIDGGHLAEEVFGDLRLAEKALLEQGIIVADDYFNNVWPGVSEGVCRFLMQNPGRLVPLAVGFHRILLVRSAAQKWYLGRLRSKGWGEYLADPTPDVKLKRFFGVDALAYLPEETPSVPRRILSRVKRALVLNGARVR